MQLLESPIQSQYIMARHPLMTRRKFQKARIKESMIYTYLAQGNLDLSVIGHRESDQESEYSLTHTHSWPPPNMPLRLPVRSLRQDGHSIMPR